jgi:dihydrofolate reductase
MSTPPPIKMPDLAFVLARSEPGGVIGAGNKMPWHLKSDMARFKAITQDHAVIMGRKTFAALGRPLPRRLNIVLSRGLGMGAPGLVVVRNAEAALQAADNYALQKGQLEIFVIGGADIFAQFEPQCRRVHLTEVLDLAIAGDTIYAPVFAAPEWRTIEEVELPASPGDDFPTRYRLLERCNARDRFRRPGELATAPRAL